MASDPCIDGPMNGSPAAGGLVPAGTVPSQRCSARRTNGEPCKRWAIVGGTVCATHGGRAPQVKDAARRRVLELAPLALEVAEDLLFGVAEDPETGEPVNVPAAVRARVVDSVLDRAGVSSRTEHDVIVSDSPRPDIDDAIKRAMASRGFLPPDAETPDTEDRDA